MLAREIEAELRNTLHWQKVEDIPNFPWHTYREIKEKWDSNEISIRIDFTTANILSVRICGQGYKVWALLLSWIPFLGVAASVVLAIALKNPFWLLAIPIIIVAELGSNPLNPLGGFFRLTMLFAFFYFLWAIWETQMAGGVLSAFYIVPYWSNKAFYLGNRIKLTRLAMDSETLFIHLYQSKSLALAVDGRLHYFRDDILTKRKEK